MSKKNLNLETVKTTTETVETVTPETTETVDTVEIKEEEKIDDHKTDDHVWTLEFLRESKIAQYYREKTKQEKFVELLTLQTIVEKEAIIGADCNLDAEETKIAKIGQFKKALNSLRFDDEGDDLLEKVEISETETIGNWRELIMELLQKNAPISDFKKLLKEASSEKTMSLEKVVKKDGYYTPKFEKILTTTNAVENTSTNHPETFKNYIASNGAYKVGTYAMQIFNTLNKAYTALYGTKNENGEAVSELEFLKFETSGFGESDLITPKTKDCHLILFFKNTENKVVGLRIQAGNSGGYLMQNGYFYCNSGGKMLKPTPAAWASSKKESAWEWVSNKLEASTEHGYKLVCGHIKTCFNMVQAEVQVTPTPNA